jgi:hypothetical protein
MEGNNQQTSGVGFSGVLEYLALAASVGGTAATVVTKQAVWAAAPLSLALLCNLVNRRRIEQAAQQHAKATQTQIQRLITEKGHSSASGVDLAPIQQQLTQLQTQDHNLQQSLDQIVQQLPASPNLEKNTALEAEVSRLSTIVAQLQANPEAAIAPVAFAPEQLGPEIHSIVAPLQAQLEALQTQMNAMPAVSPHPQTAPSATIASSAPGADTISRLQTQVGDLENQLGSVLDDLAAGLANIPALVEQNVKQHLGSGQVPSHPATSAHVESQAPLEIGTEMPQAAAVIPDPFTTIEHPIEHPLTADATPDPQETAALEELPTVSSEPDLFDLAMAELPQEASTEVNPFAPVTTEMPQAAAVSENPFAMAATEELPTVGSEPDLFDLAAAELPDIKTEATSDLSSLDDLFLDDPSAGTSSAETLTSDGTPDWDLLLAELDTDSPKNS